MLANTLEALIDIQALQNQDAKDRYIADGVSWPHYETRFLWKPFTSMPR